MSDSDRSATHSPANERASRLDFLRHPLLVGAAVAIIGAFFASLLIPSITQVTQDRPKELELKRTVVEGIAGATAKALNQGVQLARGDRRAAGGHAGENEVTVYRRVLGDWLIAESTLDAEVTTYFSQGGAKSRAAWMDWRGLRTGIRDFLKLSAVEAPNVRRDASDYLGQRLSRYKTSPGFDRQKFDEIFGNSNTLLQPKATTNVIRSLADLLEFDRDAVTLEIVGAPATGFRHSPWSL